MTLAADTPLRVRVDGEPLPGDQALELGAQQASAVITLSAGQHRLQVDYHHAGEAAARVQFSVTPAPVASR